MHKGRKRVRDLSPITDGNDTPGSLVDFIDDDALEDDDDPQSTPLTQPYQKSYERCLYPATVTNLLPSKKFPVDSDDHEVPVSKDFEEDIVESPKKQRAHHARIIESREEGDM